MWSKGLLNLLFVQQVFHYPNLVKATAAEQPWCSGRYQDLDGDAKVTRRFLQHPDHLLCELTFVRYLLNSLRCC